MVYFKLFALFWFCNSSNGAQHIWGGTLESSTKKTLLTMEEKKKNIQKSCCTFHSSTSSSPRKRTFEVGNVGMISFYSQPTQANRK